MLAARVCQASALRAPLLGVSLARQPLMVKAQQPAQSLFRTMATQSSRARVRTGELTGAAKRIAVPATPYQIGQGMLAGGALIGLGSLVYYGLGVSSEAGTIDEAMLWPQYVKDRVRDTYLYLAGSLGVTAASTVAIYRSPTALRFFNASGFRGMILPLVAVIGVGTAMRSIPYEPGFGSKQLMWMLHSGLVGGIIAPLCFLGSPLLMRAVMITAGVVGGLSTVAVCAPSDKFLNMGAPLAVGFGAVFASCLGTFFLPPTTMMGASLHSVAVYGGVILFSMMMLWHTQRLMNNAKAVPPNQQFDPINASSGMYMAIINLFLNIVNILAMNKRK